jgi:hypothetical protein
VSSLVKKIYSWHNVSRKIGGLWENRTMLLLLGRLGSNESEKVGDKVEGLLSLRRCSHNAKNFTNGVNSDRGEEVGARAAGQTVGKGYS